MERGRCGLTKLRAQSSLLKGKGTREISEFEVRACVCVHDVCAEETLNGCLARCEF